MILTHIKRHFFFLKCTVNILFMRINDLMWLWHGQKSTVILSVAGTLFLGCDFPITAFEAEAQRVTVKPWCTVHSDREGVEW